MGFPASNVSLGQMEAAGAAGAAAGGGRHGSKGWAVADTLAYFGALAGDKQCSIITRAPVHYTELYIRVVAVLSSVQHAQQSAGVCGSGKGCLLPMTICCTTHQPLSPEGHQMGMLQRHPFTR